MPRAELTAEVASDIERRILRTVHGFVLDKSNVPMIEAVRGLFDALARQGVNVPNGEQFDRTSHAIGMLYLRADNMDPLNRVLIGAHEGAHIQQFWEGEFVNDLPHDKRDLKGGVEFAWLYMVQPLARVRFELRAERARWEVLHALGKPQPTLAEVTSWLFGYYAITETPELRGFVEGFAIANLASVRSGAVQTTVGKTVIDALRVHGVL